MPGLEHGFLHCSEICNDSRALRLWQPGMVCSKSGNQQIRLPAKKSHCSHSLRMRRRMEKKQLIGFTFKYIYRIDRQQVVSVCFVNCAFIKNFASCKKQIAPKRADAELLNIFSSVSVSGFSCEYIGEMA